MIGAVADAFLAGHHAFIALEPFAGHTESDEGSAATFKRLAIEQGNRAFELPVCLQRTT